MKKLFFILVIIPALVTGQVLDDSFKITVTRTEDTDQHILRTTNFFVRIDGETITSEWFNGSIELIRYDETNKEVATKKHTMEDNEDFTLEQLIKIGSKVIVFYSRYDKKANKENLYYREIEPESLEFTGSENNFFSVDGKIVKFELSGSKYQIGYHINRLQFFESRDKSKFCIVYKKEPQSRNFYKNLDIYGFYLLDAELNQLSKREEVAQIPDFHLSSYDILVYNSGDISLVGRDNRTFEHFIYSFSGQGSMTTTSLNVNDNVFTGLHVMLNEKETLIGFGYTCKKQEDQLQSATTGGAYFSLQSSSSQIDVQTFKIPWESFLTASKMSMMEKKYNQAKELRFNIDDFTLDADGGILMVGEQSHTTYTQNGNTVYYFDDALITKFKPTGEHAWTKLINKEQKGMGAISELSVNPLYQNGKYYLFFVDNEKNFDFALYENPAMHYEGKGGILNALIVDDATGDSHRSQILSISNVGGYPLYSIPLYGLKLTDDNEITFKANQKDSGPKKVLVKITW